MFLVMYVLRRPYTVIAGLILLCILGVGAALRMRGRLALDGVVGRGRIEIEAVELGERRAGLDPVAGGAVADFILVFHRALPDLQRMKDQPGPSQSWRK